VYRVVSADELEGAALEVAKQIAAKDSRVIRAAKKAINGIDPQDVHRSYRYEQGFTFELNLTGAADEARQRFLEGK
jgi:enoyl-CoA hydratase